MVSRINPITKILQLTLGKLIFLYGLSCVVIFNLPRFKVQARARSPATPARFMKQFSCTCMT